MQKETKEAIQIYIPLILAITLNGLSQIIAVSEYVEGFLQGVAVVLLCVSVVQMVTVFKRRMKISSK